MKLLAIFVLYQQGEKDVKILQKQCDLTQFSFYTRRHIESMITFSARTTIERTALGTKQSIDLKDEVSGMIHAYVRADRLAAIVVSKNDYPPRVAYSLLTKVMNEFTVKYPSETWRDMPEGSGAMTSLGETLQKYQSPQDADPLMSLEKDLEETKGIMVKTIDNLLDRGEKLDVLVERSRDLAEETRLFYREARKYNRCCNLSW